MLNVHTMLWPTDFSDASYRALDAAKELAAACGATLWVAHALEPVSGMVAPLNFPLPVYYQEIRQEAAEKIDCIVRERIGAEQIVRTSIEMLPAAEHILRLADEAQVDMIVIATHGKSPFHHLLFGSVTEKVIRRAHCYVLIVKAFPVESASEKASAAGGPPAER